MEEVNEILTGAKEGSVTDRFILPPSFSSRSAEESEIRLRDVLSGELSDEGLAALRSEGEFGPLSEVFPEKGAKWAADANVTASECHAFRMERDGIVAELVLQRGANGWKIVRCNNVSQMALSRVAKS